MPALYQDWFGLERDPFSIAPDPRSLFMSTQHREALAHLMWGLQGAGGFILLTGEIGTGKTTLSRCLLEQMGSHSRLAYVLNPRQSSQEMLLTLCREFGVQAPGREGTAHLVDALNEFLLAQHAIGANCLAVIDEAQELTLEVLEQLRLLTNLETHERKLLQIILIGQPELRTLLAHPRMEPLLQRVVARCHLGPLSREELVAYVSHRMTAAGLRRPLPFDAAALRRIHARSAGVPRRINLLCDRALLGAYASSSASVDARIVDRADRELRGTSAAQRLWPSTVVWAWVALLAIVGLAAWFGIGHWPVASAAPS